MPMGNEWAIAKTEVIRKRPASCPTFLEQVS